MKFNQKRLFIYLILLINVATIKLTATTLDSLPNGCQYAGTIVMPDTNYGGPYILLDSGIKIRPVDTLLSEINARVQVGYELVDSSFGDILPVYLTCFKFIGDSGCYAAFSYEKVQCNSDSLIDCPKYTYRFNYISEFQVDSIFWDFGDGSHSMELNPVHTYSTYGFYEVVLTIVARNYCVSTYSSTLYIQDPATDCSNEGVVIIDDSSGCGNYILLNSGLKIQPIDTLLPEISTRVRVGYEIVDTLCGDILSATFHCFKVIGDSGCYASINYEKVQCDSDSLSNCSDKTYRFSFNSDCQIDSVFWNFGDGTSSTGYNPVHTYENYGLYPIDIKLITKTGYVSTSNIFLSISDPIYNCSNGGIIILDDSSSCGPYILLDNGLKIQPVDSLSLNLNTRVRIGYEVVDTVCGDILASNILCFEAISDSGCYSWFTYDKLQCNGDSLNNNCLENTYRFNYYSDNVVDSTIWQFGDGTYSAENYPIHTYSDFGEYEVFLKTFTRDGCVSISSLIISVQDSISHCPYTGTFVISDSSNCGPYILLDYGLKIRPTNVMPPDSTVRVRLDFDYWIADSSSCDDALNAYLTCFEYIFDPIICQADFAISAIDSSVGYDSAYFVGKDYVFTDVSGNDITERIWNINGTIIYNDFQPIYSFSSEGIYSICLTITTASGCTSEICKSIEVAGIGCKADFTYEIAEPDCKGYSPAVLFKPSVTSDSYNYLWSFGDKKYSTKEAPAHYYKKGGYYTVCLTVTGLDSCQETKCQAIYLPKNPKKIFRNTCKYFDNESQYQSLLTEELVYPVPADDQVNIVLNSLIDQSVDIKIYDLRGQVKKAYSDIELSIGKNTIELDVNDLRKGNYLYLISSPETNLHGRIFIN